MACNEISDVARTRMTDMVDAGHFKKESEGDATEKVAEKRTNTRGPKKGATFAAVEESDNESGDKASARSALPTYEEHLRQQGIIQLNVGGEKPWNGDDVSAFGFGFLHVGHKQAGTNGFVLAGAVNE